MAANRCRKKKLCGLPHFSTENLWLGVVLVCLLASAYFTGENSDHHDEAVVPLPSSPSIPVSINNNNINNKQHSQYVGHIQNLLAANERK